jgi:hypothetical protein
MHHTCGRKRGSEGTLKNGKRENKRGIHALRVLKVETSAWREIR